MKRDPTSDYPSPPVGVGDTATQIFETAAAQSAATSGDRSAGDLLDDRPPLTSLQARLAAARGQPVRVGRHDVLRCIGLGGMGVVYEAVDVETGQRVALKTLRARSGAALARFKREFRTLAGVVHDNLVVPHELSVEDGEWFFTMEHVAGVSFADLAHAGSGARGAYLGETMRVEDRPPPAPGPAEPEAPRDPGERPRATFHEARLRAALAQLAGAIAALHARGLLHRDLNASNVLITAEGRVVVIDFGLTVDRSRRRAPREGISGTPGYMSPEQAAGKPETAASDWYAFGVMLFEVLTGRLPFRGSAARTLRRKQEVEAPRASSLVTGVPEDLDDLAAALLRRRPDERPDAPAILDLLGAPRAPAPCWPLPVFVGRRDEIAALSSAYLAAQSGEPTVALVSGPPGTGVTALCDRFLQQRARADHAVVLRGRAGAREVVPHRGVDAVVDALAAHLGALDAEERAPLLPPDAPLLARAFPVLEAIVAAAPRDDGDGGRRVWAALSEILRRIAEAAPLAIWIDDAGAGPLDAAALGALVPAPRPPARAPILILSGSGLDALPPLPAKVRAIRLEPLPSGDTRALCRQALRRSGGDADRAGEIARAACGNPAAAVQLARWISEDPDVPDASFEAWIEAQLRRQSDAALRVLDVLAAADAPIPQAVACALAGLGASPRVDPITTVARLAGARLARAGGARAGDLVAVHDERVRAVVIEKIAPSVLRRLHLDLADAIARLDPPDPARVAAHLHRGGDDEGAARAAVIAADRAAASRAYDRAAQLYSEARAFLGPRGDDEGAVALRHAEALASAGRVVEAARAYLDAAAGAPAAEALDRRRRAAEQLLIASRVGEGLAILAPVMAAHGVRYPGTPRAARLLLAARLLEIRVRGTTPSRAPSPAARARALVAWTAAKGLWRLDRLRAGAFMAESLLAALASGDPALVAPPLAMVGVLHVYEGSASAERRGDDMVEEAARLARRAGDPYLLGFTWCCAGVARLAAGRFREALARVDEGLAAIHAGGAPAVWERNTFRPAAGYALLALGSLRERARRAEIALAEAEAEADPLGEAEAALQIAYARLSAGDPGGARALLHRARALLPRDAITLHHQSACVVDASIHLHEGAPAQALAAFEAACAAMEESPIRRIPVLRTELDQLAGAIAVACAAADPARRSDHLDRAEAAADRLVSARRVQGQPAAVVLRAGAAWARGASSRAVDLFRAAAAAYETAEMKIHAAAARRVAAAIAGGSAAAADAALAAEGVAHPARWARLITGAG